MVRDHSMILRLLDIRTRHCSPQNHPNDIEGTPRKIIGKGISSKYKDAERQFCVLGIGVGGESGGPLDGIASRWLKAHQRQQLRSDDEGWRPTLRGCRQWIASLRAVARLEQDCDVESWGRCVLLFSEIGVLLLRSDGRSRVVRMSFEACFTISTW